MPKWIPDSLLDLRFATRAFAKRPAFTAAAVLTLALGIAAATTVFSIVDAVLLRPLPYKDPARLVAIWTTSTREASLAKLFATYRDYLEFRNHSRTLESVSVATWATNTSRVLTGWGPARSVLTIPASSSFFQTLGVQAAIGRVFAKEDETRGCSIVVARNFWMSTLHADPTIIGKSLTLDQQSCIVLGVMPDSFSFYPTPTQAWVLITPGFQPDLDHLLVGIFARLRPGVSPPQAQSELRSLYRAIHTDAGTRDFAPVVYDLHGEFTFLAGRTLRTTLMLLFGAVLLVLFISCLNVANLWLARLSERRRELAVRAALGSGQSRIVRQVLTESLLLSFLGSVSGIAVAYAALAWYRALNPIELTAGAVATMNVPVLIFSLALSVATTLIFGLLPALRASKIDLTEHLKAAGRGFVRGRHRLAESVIALEMAISFLLLVGATLLMTSAIRMGSENLGFNYEHVEAARVVLPVSRYSTDTQRILAYGRLLTGLERAPGSLGVTLASKLPPEAGGNQVLELQGSAVDPAHQIHDVGADAVSPGFFSVLDIPLRQGRAFDARDRETSAPVAIINDALAKEYFPNTEPLGQQIRLAGGQMPWLTVVGVVGNLKHTQLMNEMSWVETPIFYRPFTQEPRQRFQIAIRRAASTDAATISRAIEQQITSFDPSIPSDDVEPLASRLASTLAYPRFRAIVLTLFGLGALLLSSVGLHGVLAQVVAQRIPEFGIRKAIGAQTYNLLWLVARQGGLPIVTGLAIGLGLTLALSRVLSNLLYGVQPADPATLLVVSLMLLAVASLAILSPAMHAARVDPMNALRDE